MNRPGAPSPSAVIPGRLTRSPSIPVLYGPTYKSSGSGPAAGGRPPEGRAADARTRHNLHHPQYLLPFTALDGTRGDLGDGGPHQRRGPTDWMGETGRLK